VAGEEESHELVAKLHVIHVDTAIIVCVEESLQEVVGGSGGGAARTDDGEDDPVEFAAREKEAGRFGNRKTFGKKEGEGGLSKKPVHHGGNGGADGAGIVVEFGTEQAAGDDFEGELSDFEVKVSGLLVAPTGKVRGGRIGHDGGVGRNVFVTEGGLDELALSLPVSAFVGEEAAAKDEFEGGIVARLMEFGGLADENIFDVIRMSELADGCAEETVEGDVAEVASTTLAEARPVAGEFGSGTEEEITPGTGRVSGRERHGEMVRPKRGIRKWNLEERVAVPQEDGLAVGSRR